MSKALQLARKGFYSTHPNPRVGCVIVRDGGMKDYDQIQQMNQIPNSLFKKFRFTNLIEI